MSTLELVDPVNTVDGLHLPFRRARVERPEASVLLLHGASAASNTFITPPPASKYPNLVSYLNDAGLDVWTLDWRGSNQVAAAQASNPKIFTINEAAANDVPAAVRRIRQCMKEEGRGEDRLSVLGHCLGGGVLAAAVADGRLLGQDVKVDSVVLSALGLFYASPWDGCVKVQDYIIEQVLAKGPKKPTVDVGIPAMFPPPMDAAYEKWPAALRIECDTEICFQLSFMFGHPYIEENLVKGIHDNKKLAVLFNHMPLTLYLHCGQNLRRGMYAPLDTTEDRVRCPAPKSDAFTMPVTLITGELNALWHRESVDRMHEWLLSNGKRSEKHVVPTFAHQDLLWGTGSEKAVFEHMLDGLRRV